MGYLLQTSANMFAIYIHAMYLPHHSQILSMVLGLESIEIDQATGVSTEHGVMKCEERVFDL